MNHDLFVKTFIRWFQAQISGLNQNRINQILWFERLIKNQQAYKWKHQIWVTFVCSLNVALDSIPDYLKAIIS